MFENHHGCDGFRPEVLDDRVTDEEEEYEDHEEEYEDHEKEEEIREGEEEDDEEEEEDGEDSEEEVDEHDHDECDVDSGDAEVVGEEAEEDEETTEDQEPDQHDESNQIYRADEEPHPAQDLVQFPQRFASSKSLIINSKYSLGCPFPGCKKTFDRDANLRHHAMVHTCYRPCKNHFYFLADLHPVKQNIQN
jgi:hypothetical protein